MTNTDSRGANAVLAILSGLLVLALLQLPAWKAAFPRAEALAPAVQLFAGMLTLTLLGSAVRLTQSPAPVATPVVGLLGLGQLILCCYILLRSGLNRILVLSTGWYLPLSTAEIIPAIAMFVLWSHRRRQSTPIRVSPPFVTLLALLSLLASQLELPREMMLSSDPDQHAFWAMQIRRVGTVPFEQGFWGPRHFDYPAGFAVLNYAWQLVTGLDARDVLSVFPLLQSMFAVLLLVETAVTVAGRGLTATEQTAAAFLCILVYLFAFPYGYQERYILLQGSGRVCSIFVISQIFSRLLLAASGVASHHGLLFMGVSTTFAMLMNPANVFLAAALTGAYAVLQLRQTDFRSLAFLLVLAPLIVLCDPYYFDQVASLTGSGRFASLAPGSKGSDNAVPLLQRGMLWFERSFGDGTPSLFDRLQVFLSFERLGIPAAQVAFAVAVLIAVVLITLARRRIRFPSSWLIAVAIFPGPLFFATTYLFYPIFELSPEPRFARLLSAYLLENAYQYVYLWVMLCIAGSVLALLSLLGTAAAVVPLTALLLLWLQLGPHSSLMVKARHEALTANGEVTDGDLAVIAYIEKLYNRYLQENPNPAADTVPRILIPNSPQVLYEEEWLFPVGAARLLAYRDVFPLAFYYYQGSEDFSYAEYRRTVCEDFNLDWLRARRIKYLFIPRYRKLACVAKWGRIPGAKILFHRSHAQLLQLYDD